MPSSAPPSVASSSVASSSVPSSVGPSASRPGAAVSPAVAPAHPAPPKPASASPSASPSAPSTPPSPSAESPRPHSAGSPWAGRPAGEGRPRPGRTLTPAEIARADALDEAAEEAEATESAAVPAITLDPRAHTGTGRMSRQALEGPAVEQVQQMSLGAGIALVGMGLGFLALRMRRSG
ncbi:hypothetical protein [Streptomyces sp. NBC_01013]|uniref:hypothetical protein n=1 Tax=Streptomyces sp. NBC_01013 TaxID=2903718 RepID=UPI003866EE3D|nr:hypothetical protein OG538_18315 [Streptomyces sp. NBC_01013]